MLPFRDSGALGASEDSFNGLLDKLFSDKAVDLDEVDVESAFLQGTNMSFGFLDSDCQEVSLSLGTESRFVLGQSKTCSGGSKASVAATDSLPSKMPTFKARPRRRTEGQWTRNKRTQDRLKQQLDEVQQQLEQLNVTNRYLQNKRVVLEFFVGQVSASIEHSQTRNVPEEQASSQTGTSCGGVTGASPIWPDRLVDSRMARYIAGWKGFVGKCSSVLIEESSKYPDLSSSPAVQEVAMGACSFVRGAMSRPERLAAIMALNLDTGCIEDPPQHLWHSAVLNLQLSRAQCQDFIEAYDGWMAKIAQIWQERNNVAQQALVSDMQMPDQIRAVKAARALHRCQLMQHQFTLLMLGIMFRRILCPHQVLDVVVQCYPFCPDPVALVEAVRATHLPQRCD